MRMLQRRSACMCEAGVHPQSTSPHPSPWPATLSRFYVVVLANPPDTGDEEGGRLFTIDIDRVPADTPGKQL